MPGKGSDNTFTFTDRRDLVAFLGIDPFSEVKNKWLSGLKFEMGWWYCAVDARAVASNSCNMFAGTGKREWRQLANDHL